MAKPKLEQIKDTLVSIAGSAFSSLGIIDLWPRTLDALGYTIGSVLDRQRKLAAADSKTLSAVQNGDIEFTPIALFLGGSDGGWYDPSDISTLWQDSARTTPVTASGQPVGAMDDKSGNGRHLLQATAAARPTYLSGDTPATFGAELCGDGGFDTGAGWTAAGGWAIGGGVLTGTAATGNTDRAITVTAGKLYRIIYTVSGYSAGSVRAQFTGGTTTSGIQRTANGTYTEYIRAETGNVNFNFDGVLAFTGIVDNVSVTEVLTFTGYPCLRFDGVDDCLIEAGTHTMALPVYMIAAISKVADGTTVFCGSRKGNSDYVVLANSTTGRVSNAIRSTALAQVSPVCGNNEAPPATKFVFDGLHVAGTSSVRVNNNTEVTAVNLWTTETLTLSKIQIASTTGSVAAAHDFFGSIYLLANPGASGRANAKRYLGNKIGLSL